MNKIFFKKVYFYLYIMLTSNTYMNNSKYKLIILNLHRVSEDNNIFYPSLHPTLFEELLKYITKHFNVITFNQINEFKNSPKPNIILSFDDGFYDFEEYAMPLMQKYNIQANLNVIPACMESGMPVWDVLLGDILNQTSPHVINRLDLPGFELKLSGSNQTQYALALTAYLKNRKREEREILWQQFEEIMHSESIKPTRMLSKEDVKEIAKIHEIGAHSYSHESMQIEGNRFFQEDFFRCQTYFEEQLDMPLDIYAFPSGSYTHSQIAFLQKQSVKHILLVNEDYSTYGSYVYNRFTFYGDSVSEIKMRALGWRR